MMAENTRMLSTSTPTTPIVRRSFTLPIRPPDSNKSSPNQSPQVETLYGHSSARVVQFTAGSPFYAKPFLAKDAASADEEAGSLSWTSNIERTIAVGPLRVYRAPNSVAFLNCGRVIQAILPKSKCWCVEESGKFVLQMRKPQYWRIEINDVNPEDTGQVEKLKDVFSEILLFEKTLCPFQRDFTVNIPEPLTTPIKYRPWRPVARPVEKLKADFVPVFTQDDSSITSTTRSRATTLQEAGENAHSLVPVSNDRGSIIGTECDIDATEHANDSNHDPLHEPLTKEERGTRPEVLQTSRSVTAPPQLTLVTAPPSKAIDIKSSSRGTVDELSPDDVSLSGSFHSVQSWHSPTSPSAPSGASSQGAPPTSPTMFLFPHDNIHLPKRSQHIREFSEDTITPETPAAEASGIWESSHNCLPGTISEESEGLSTPPPRTPTLIDDLEDNLDEEHFEVCTPPTQQRLRHRPTTGSNSRRRALSPLPAAANIFSPSGRRPRHLQTARHLPTAIIQKTCEILLSPPSHLLHIMLDMAAKIAAGEWRGMVYGLGEGGESVVDQWDYEEGHSIPGGWEEDDYGISLTANARNDVKRSEGGSWEID